MRLGIDRLLAEGALRKPLQGRRVALLGHPASVNHVGRHSLDALMALGGLDITAAFGPQHGMRGDKQDNMVESGDYVDPLHGIPVFSLYGDVRHPTDAMLDHFDVLLVDLQDIGTRIYTYVTTLAYVLDACARRGKAVWILDRPNPAGRPMEGSLLEPGWESFVGAGPLLMRHGLTLGELALWFVAQRGLDLECRVIDMDGYQPQAAPGYGWPRDEIPWVNPSPNASSLNMARCYPGTVLLEGTTLSEGRGTTTPLELMGAPELDICRLLQRMESLCAEWMQGAVIRCCAFEPTFHKHQGQLCHGVQIHTDTVHYQHHRFSPYRLVALLLKALRLEYPDYPIWRDFAYEYETERLAIDLISGGTFLRQWVDDAATAPSDLDARLRPDEQAWAEQTQPFRRY
ncbi:exo-beta-N-acetylmuramidase NamZ family protein [Thiohalocapsa marina]|uniref:exo-beta-N-acetylmuramidase NamZ family protein n=1 Tax=Thiohalocapsa marina TaxID=424902 RepID=UPI0036DCB4AC